MSFFVNSFYNTTFALFINENRVFIGSYLNEKLFLNLISFLIKYNKFTFYSVSINLNYEK